MTAAGQRTQTHLLVLSELFKMERQAKTQDLAITVA